MKKLFPLLVFFPFALNAQSLIGGKNIVKLNVSSLVVKNYNVTFERKILPHITLSLGVRYMPLTGMPLANLLEPTSQSVDLGNSKVGSLAITPEIRFYLWGAMKGFYTAPYLRYSHFNLQLPVRYKDYSNPSMPVQEEAGFSGLASSYSIGNMIGYQR